jgi:acyl-CoA synthetase (AMP-forming)/AMP-acid ligase II
MPGSDDETTVYEAFIRAQERYGERPFLHIPAHCSGGPAELTYAQAAERVARLATVYREAGYGAGHHIATWLDNRADCYLHWLAVNAIGATFIPFGAESTLEEASYLLQRADVDLLVHLPERSGGAQHAVRSLDGLARATPAAFERGVGVPSASTPRSTGAPSDLAAIVFTSGSTGQPKGCMLSNRYFLTFGRWYRDLGGRCTLRPGAERLITPLPLNHVNALAFSSMGMILTGGCIIQLERFRSSTWWSTVHDSGATVMHYLGVMPAMLLQLPPQPHDRGHALRFGIGGGVRAAHHAPFEERFGVPLIEAWAMTETGGAGTLSTHIGPRNIGSGCIGQTSPRYAEAAIEGDNGEPLEDGAPHGIGRHLDGDVLHCVGEPLEDDVTHNVSQPLKGDEAEIVGELLVRAPGINPRQGFFSGYYKDPAATAAAWQSGWLHTGDLGKTR